MHNYRSIDTRYAKAYDLMKKRGGGSETFDWRLVRSFLAVLNSGSLMGAARTL
jgi:hypothetical protein